MKLEVEDVGRIAGRRYYRDRKWYGPVGAVLLAATLLLIVVPLAGTYVGATKVYESVDGDEVVIKGSSGAVLNGYRLTRTNKTTMSSGVAATLAVGIVLGVCLLGLVIYVSADEGRHRDKFVQDFVDSQTKESGVEL